MNQRNVNVVIPFIKLILAYSVAMNHFMGREILLTGGWSVDFFFIISGFFLANSFMSGKYESVGQYSIHRLQSLYKQYIVAFVLLFAFTIISAGQFGIMELTRKVIGSLPEVFLLQNVGWFNGGINYPLWFLCDLIVVSHILFALLKNNIHITVNVICPIIVLLVGAYYMNVYEDHDVMTWGVEGKFFYVPLLRTACFLSIGILLYYAKNRMDRSIAVNSKVAALLFVICTCMYAVTINTPSGIIPFIILLMSTFYISFPEKIYGLLCKVRKIVDDLSLSVFFNQALIILVLNENGISMDGGRSDLLVYCTTLTVFCLFIGVIIPYGIRAFRNNRID